MAKLDSEIMLRRAPLATVADVVRPGLSCKAEQDLGIAKLRIFGTETDARFRAVVNRAAPPACTQTEDKGLAFAWLAPGEWLVTGPQTDVDAWLTRAAALDADDLLAVDFSHARTAFLLEGANAPVTLAGHCPLDLWTEVFPVGAVAQSLLGDIVMFIARLADARGAPCFRIVIDQTMAAYVRRLFARA